MPEALVAIQKAIVLTPGDAEAHYNFGLALHALGKLDGVEASYRRAIILKPGFAEAQNNLDITLHALGKLDEAEVRYRNAIMHKPDFAKARSNLGITLQEFDRFKEAENCYTHAIALRPSLALAHQNLSIARYINDNINSALDFIEKANHIDPKFKPIALLLSLLKSKKPIKEITDSVNTVSNPKGVTRLTPNLLILHRAVEAEFIATPYEMSSRKIEDAKDARCGNGTFSSDFNLFTSNRDIVKTVAQDLKIIMMNVVKSEIYIDNSFFNILGASSGTTPHRHINNLDKIKGLNLD